LAKFSGYDILFFCFFCQAIQPDFGLRHPCAALLLQRSCSFITLKVQLKSEAGASPSKDSLRSSINHLNPGKSIISSIHNTQNLPRLSRRWQNFPGSKSIS